MKLWQLVIARREEIMRRWIDAVRGELHPTSVPRPELVDHLPTFLAEVAEALRMSEGTEKSQTAAEHGIQRLALGFSLDGVVREYGALNNAIVEEARAQGVAIIPAAMARFDPSRWVGLII